MFFPNRLISKKGPDSWIIPDEERVLYGAEQQFEEGIADIIGQQGATSEAVRGVVGAATKISEIGVDATYPLMEVVDQSREAYVDFFRRMPHEFKQGEKMKAVGYGLKAPGRILISPLLAIKRYPKRIAQMFYDGSRAVGDLTGVKVEYNGGLDVGLHDKGLVPAVASLGRSVYNIAKTPFALFKGGKTEAKKAPPAPPKEEPEQKMAA